MAKSTTNILPAHQDVLEALIPVNTVNTATSPFSPALSTTGLAAPSWR